MVELRRLNLQDVEQAFQLSKSENWNQTEKEWELLVGNPQNTCLAAAAGEKLIGTATAINYEDKVAWIGMVIVDRDYRGQRISNLLLSNLIETSENRFSLKRDATPAGLPVYEKFGFIDEYLVHRFTTSSVIKINLIFEPVISIEKVSKDNLDEVIEYDKKIFGADRKQIIEFLFRNFPEKTWVLRKDGQIHGIALGRKGRMFHQVGPVYASNLDFAKILILKSLEICVNQPVVFDIPKKNTELINWIKTLGFEKQRHFVRMYRNENTFAGLTENQFLICGPEFG